MLAKPVGHGHFLGEDALADLPGLSIANGFGGGDENGVGSDLQVLEDVTRLRSFDDLVIDGHSAERLPHRHHLAAQILDARIGFVIALQTALHQLGLVLRFGDVLFDTRFQGGIVLDAAGLLVQHGFGLSLHRVRVTQPFDQTFDADVVASLCALHELSPVV